MEQLETVRCELDKHKNGTGVDEGVVTTMKRKLVAVENELQVTIDELEKSKKLVTELRVERDAVGGDMDKLRGELARLRTGSQPPGGSARPGGVTSADATWVKINLYLWS